MNRVLINDKDLIVKQMESERVVTFADVDRLHERAEGTSSRNFRENKKHFIKGNDYFELTGQALDEFRRSLPEGIISKFTSQLILITESGYLMLVKSLTDDLAWKVQRQLVDNYFRVKEVDTTINNQYDLLRGMIDQMEQTNQIAKRAEQDANKALQEVTATAEVVKEVANKVDTTITSEDVKASDVARLLNLRSKSGLAHNSLIGAIARKLGFKIGYKHCYQDKYIKVIQDEDGRGHRTYYKPAGVDKMVNWFENNKDIIYYEDRYKKSGSWGNKGDVKECGYKVNGVNYKIQR